MLDRTTSLSKSDPGGRYIHYGIREHAMGAAMVGMAKHGGVLPVGGTFFVFSDYMKPAIRLASLSKAKVCFVFTHDSVGVGEDGPTHQPVEHLAALRAIPGLHVIRPADANETIHAWVDRRPPRRADGLDPQPPEHRGDDRRLGGGDGRGHRRRCRVAPASCCSVPAARWPCASPPPSNSPMPASPLGS